MNFFERTKRHHLHIVVWILTVFFVVSCGNQDRLEGILTKQRPFPTATPPVAYGASLGEWNQVTQTDAEPAVSSTSESSSVESSSVEANASNVGIPFAFNNVVYQEIMWDGLIPPDYSAETIMAKYDEQLAKFEDGSPEASEIFRQMQEEFNDAPVNELLNDTLVRLPGFIAPLDYQNEFITEFLLVPYFGACIHVPPPPANQTVLVKAAEGQGITLEESYSPIWVMGKLTSDETITELATAGYHIQDAVIEPYTDPQ